MSGSTIHAPQPSAWWTSTAASYYATGPMDSSQLPDAQAQEPAYQASLNTWEEAAIKAEEEYGQPAAEVAAWDPGYVQRYQRPQQMDALIYPGLYSHSGFDMLEILFRVTGRPNPQVEIGAVDAACALILCDLCVPDTPIVYASEPFLALTGYTADEVLNRNCRFLQAPPPARRNGGNGSTGSGSSSGGGTRGGKTSSSAETVLRGSRRKHVSPEIIRAMRKAVETNVELQLEVPNFRKDGSGFINILTMIPITWPGTEPNLFRYSVGFQCAKE